MDELEMLVTKSLIFSTCKLTNTLSTHENAKIGFVSTIYVSTVHFFRRIRNKLGGTTIKN